uniref:VWFA domain-containing protein n=1 Tax=Ciona savignyi TaxID=51511 RepID=H2ZCD6_CIOSA
WLQQGSREVFGTILEEQVYILIDTSQSMRDKLNLVKEKLFQLMQEQLRHKSKFNLIKFDTKAQAWRDRAADVTEQNLLNAWNWVKDIGVGGSTNTLAAIRIALSDPHTHAIYILTDGRPDQNPRAILAQVQLQHPVPIHTIAFNCNDVEANKFLFQLSSDTGGRYHNFSTNGMVSDGPPPFEVNEDVSLLKKEVAQGKKDLEKVSKLRARCVMLDWYHNTKHKVKTKPATQRPVSYAYPHKVIQSSMVGCYLSPRRLWKARYQNQWKLIKVMYLNSAKTSALRQNQCCQAKTRALRQMINTQWINRINKNCSNVSKINHWIIFCNLEVISKEKKKRLSSSSLDIPNSVWLKKNGLVARKLTVMDVLTPTIVRVTPKYIPVLDTHVVSKVFNDVLPIAHVSPRSKKEIRLVNPAAVDLPGYDTRLQAVIVEYKTRLDLMVWRKLSQEEREKFENGPVSYFENTDSIRQAFDRMGWPLEEKDIQLLVDEIHLGERYLQQSTDLQNTAKKSSPQRVQFESRKSSKKRRKFIDRLRGQSVIARDECDGFYYPGMVKHCTDMRHALVVFEDRPEAIVPTRFVISMSGAISCPQLRVGDYVLALNEASGNASCFVPGMVVGTPKRSQAHNKFFSILNYDNTKASLLRKNLVKISEVRYSFATRYIE